MGVGGEQSGFFAFQIAHFRDEYHIFGNDRRLLIARLTVYGKTIDEALMAALVGLNVEPNILPDVGW
jgi:hypothetical protein